MDSFSSRTTPELEPRDVWGILGGLGPLASAEFLKTIYEYTDLISEQDAPIVILFSDPAFPDRTTSLAEGVADKLLHRLEDRMVGLLKAGATNIAICCLTIHSIFPRLRSRLREKTISLVDVAVDAVHQSPFGRHLLLCTNGSRQTRLFEGHESWPADRIVLPSSSDQHLIHEFIYRLKQTGDTRRFCELLEELLEKYDADSFIAGCTEVHLVSKAWKNTGHRCGLVDPLDVLAAHIAGRRSIPEDGAPNNIRAVCAGT